MHDALAGHRAPGGLPAANGGMHQGRTLLVASTGGHLEQLYRLSRRFQPALGDVEWATFDTGQSRHLLADETVTFVPFVRPKDAKGTLANVAEAARMVQRGTFVRVISTGAAVALPFLAQARLRGIAAHYIESAARSTGPSLTGSMMARVPGVRLYGQYPAWTSGRWQYRGAVFDGFRPGPSSTSASVRRVVVTFGTQRGFGFRRAAERLVEILPSICTADASIVWQTGATDMTGLDVPWVDTMPAAELQQAVADADLVISHAGVGTSLLSLEKGKCPVLLPRRHSFGEHTDDHQRLIAEELSARGLAVNADAGAVTPEDLLRAAGMSAGSVDDPPPFVLQPDRVRSPRSRRG